jgi:hypothetical protein
VLAKESSVVFIDELDRCNPVFAVRLIERLKHFFEIENLVFVLLMNRQQLEGAIKGVYGADTDAAAYLDKFVHLFFRLPNNAGRNFVPNVFARYGFVTSDPGSVLVDRFKEHLGVWIEHANLSLRDVERACALFALADDKDSPGLLAHLITLRIKKPTIYAGLLRNAREAQKEAVDWVMNSQRSPGLKEQTADDPHSPAFYFNCLIELHSMLLNYPSGSSTPCLDRSPNIVLGEVENRSRERAIQMGLRRIDLSLEV